MNRELSPAWWQRPLVAVLLVLAMAVPLLWPAIPPFVDLPAHMARYRMQLDIDTSPYLSRYFELDWQLVPNLAVDLLVMPVAALIGLEPAVKLIIVLIPVLFGIGMLWVAREAHGHIPPTAFFALPLGYAYPLHYGFVNFCLATALAFCSFALWLRLARSPRTGLRSALFVAVSLILWVAHAFGWGILGLLVFGSELHRHLQSDAWHRALVRSALRCLPLSAPLVPMLIWQGEGGGPTYGWFDIGLTIRWLVGPFRDRWMALDLASLAIVYGLIGAAVLARRWFTVNWLLGLPALLLWTAVALMPSWLFGSYLASVRLIPYAAAVSVLAIRPAAALPAKGLQLIAMAGLLFFGIRLASHTVSFWLYDRSHRAVLGALEHVQQGSRVLAFVRHHCGSRWYTPRLMHIPSIATVRREAFTNDQFSGPGAQILKIKYRQAAPFLHTPSEKIVVERCEGTEATMPEAIARMPRGAFDYLWLLDFPPEQWPKSAGLRPIWRTEDSALYNLRGGAPARPHAQ